MTHEPCPFCDEAECLEPVIYTTKKKVQKGYIKCRNCGAQGQLAYGQTDKDDFEALVWYNWDERVTS